MITTTTTTTTNNTTNTTAKNSRENTIEVTTENATKSTTENTTEIYRPPFKTPSNRSLECCKCIRHVPEHSRSDYLEGVVYPHHPNLFVRLPYCEMKFNLNDRRRGGTAVLT
ncbi:hypothetical protein JTB14_002306 [Gonioctena quinquepunctata]|nr:hypothetical protein JTB14_002306 [Gonioctena quinquepunctata]